MLAVGTRLHQPQLRWGIDRDLKLVRIDIDPVEITRYFKPALGIVADAKAGLAALHTALGRDAPSRPSRQDELEALKSATLAGLDQRLGPQCEYLRAIRAELPDDGIYVEDLTQVGYVGRMAFPVYHPRTYIHSGYQGTLGFGFATALGAKVGRPDLPVVSVCGDGGFMFNVQELSTAVRHGIDIVAIVFADGAYGNVRRMQKGGLRQPADRRRSLEPALPEIGRELWRRRGAHDDPRRVAPRARRRLEAARHHLDRGRRRRDARPVESADPAAHPRDEITVSGELFTLIIDFFWLSTPVALPLDGGGLGGGDGPGAQSRK